MALSKPKLPLGVAEIQGKRKCVLFEPFETEEQEEEVCCVCLCPHRWGQHCDLQCLHTLCYVCLRKMIVEEVRSRGLRAPWKCPMCRKDLHCCQTSTCLRRHRAGRNDTRDAPSLNVWFRIAERRPAGALVAQHRAPDSTGFLVKYNHSFCLGDRPLPARAAIARGGMTPATPHH